MKNAANNGTFPATPAIMVQVELADMPKMGWCVILESGEENIYFRRMRDGAMCFAKTGN